MNDITPHTITPALACKLIANQFPEFAYLEIQPVKLQGHDNRTFRLGDNMLIRMPSAESYALKVPKEQELLPKLASHLTVDIPSPIKIGSPSDDYPFSFSIYKWLDGESANSFKLDESSLANVALDLAKFLKELQSIDTSFGPTPGQHNWYRGDHVSVYDKDARQQIAELSDIIDSTQALNLWERACSTKWSKSPVWIHGDFAYGNILIKDGRLSGVIDFGGTGIGDPACDLVIAWTFLKGKSREIFINAMDLDDDAWLRAKAWSLWKASWELCHAEDKNSIKYLKSKRVIEEVLL
ncbi:MAG: aminoglycoside phosphotransferase family protein [Pseudomonadota bacterium]